MKSTFWAIGDLHLSLAKPRDLSRFGNQWLNHSERIASNWRAHVQPEDVVLLLGDTSWAASYKHVKPDLQWIDSLPGRKILVRGNHDRWWCDIREVRKYILPDSMYALQGDCIEVNGVLICGAQGHIAPNDPYYRPDPPHNRYERELMTLRSALECADRMRTQQQPLVIMMHYPPFTSEGEPTPYTELIQQLAPATCFYGHLHKAHEWKLAVQGDYMGIKYRLLASDFIDMMPHKVELP